MIVVLKHGVEAAKREQLIDWLKGQGLTIHISEGEYQTVLGLVGDTTRVDMDLIGSLGIVDSVKRVTEPFKCCNRKFHPDDTVVEVGGVKIGGGNFCHDRRPLLRRVRGADRRGGKGRQGLRREHAARRRVQAPHLALRLSGPEGRRASSCCKIARQETGLPIVTEIMGVEHLPLFEDVDVIQVGARNMQNFDLLQASSARLRKPILLKRGLASTLKELLMSAEYIMAGGNEQVILCERGIRTFDDYTRNTLDLAAVPMLHGADAPAHHRRPQPCHRHRPPGRRRWRWPQRPAARTASSSRCTTTPCTPCATARSPCARRSMTTWPKKVRSVREVIAK